MRVFKKQSLFLLSSNQERQMFFIYFQGEMYVIFQFFVYPVNVFSFTSSDESFFLEQRWKKIKWKKNKRRHKTGSLMRKCYKGYALEKVDLSHQLLHLNFISEIFMLSLKKSLWKQDKNAVTIICKYLLQILKNVVHKWKNKKSAMDFLLQL